MGHFQLSYRNLRLYGPFSTVLQEHGPCYLVRSVYRKEIWPIVQLCVKEHFWLYKRYNHIKIRKTYNNINKIHQYWHLHRSDCRNILIYAHTTSRTLPTCDISLDSLTLPTSEIGDFVETILLYPLHFLCSVHQHSSTFINTHNS
jgi:hypothetical protein